MKTRLLPLLSLALLAGCTTPPREPAPVPGPTATERYWQIQAENARPHQP